MIPREYKEDGKRLTPEEPVVIQAVSGRPGQPTAVLVEQNGVISAGASTDFGPSVQAQADQYVQQHIDEQPADSQAAIAASQPAPVFNSSAPRVKVDIPQGGDFAATRNELLKYENGTRVQLGDSSNEDVYVYNGGLVNSRGEYYTGYGGVTSGMAVVERDRIINETVNGKDDTNKFSFPNSPRGLPSNDNIKKNLPGGGSNNSSSGGGSGIMMISAAPVAASLLNSNWKDMGVSPRKIMQYSTGAGMAGLAAGGLADRALKYYVDSPTYKSDPTDTTGFKDPLHAQDAYNTFAGGIGWITGKIDDVAGGVSDWYADYHHKLNTGGLSLRGGAPSQSNPVLVKPTGGNPVSDSVEKYSPGIANFGAKTIQYMNPLVGVPMLIGAGGMIGSGAVLAGEGTVDTAARAGQTVNKEMRETGDYSKAITKGFDTAKDTTFVRSAVNHIVGADIPYGEPVKTGETVENIPAGTSGFPAGGTKTIENYEQKVYHIPGLGERAVGVLSDPGAILGSVMGGSMLSGLAKGASTAGRGLGAGSKFAAGTDDLVYSWKDMKSYSGAGNTVKTTIKSGSSGKISVSGEGFYNPATGEFSATGPAKAAAMTRPSTLFKTGKPTTTNGGYANIMSVNVGRGKFFNIGGMTINPGNAVGTMKIIGGAGYLSELPTGGSVLSDEIRVKNYNHIDREINIPTQDYGFVDKNKNKNKNVNGYADEFKKIYGFNPGNAYNNGKGHQFIGLNKYNYPTDNKYTYPNPKETVFDFKYKDEYKYGIGNSYKTGYGLGSPKGVFRLPGIPGMGGGSKKLFGKGMSIQKYATGDVTGLIFGKKKRKTKRR